MKAVGIVLSFGRVELCELLACWERQTVTVPLFLWLDGPTPPLGTLPPSVHAYAAPKLGSGSSLGEARRAAVEHARTRFNLGPRDAYLAIEDDDYYHPQHVELTLQALRHAPWTGAHRVGLQRARGQVPSLLTSTSTLGPGPHGTWGLRLSAYDAAGGYTGVRLEDVDLGQRIGWQHCVGHRYCTHVRREHGFGMSALAHDREASRQRSQLAGTIVPTWSSELGALESWCTTLLRTW